MIRDISINIKSILLWDRSDGKNPGAWEPSSDPVWPLNADDFQILADDFQIFIDDFQNFINYF